MTSSYMLAFVISLSAGCLALPILLQINMVIQQKQVNEVLANRDELPVSKKLL